ncbi:copia protein [Tanacetum coccineum]
MGLWYSKDIDMSLTAYSNADHTGCQDTRRNTSGSAQFLGDKLVSWSSKKQKSTAISNYGFTFNKIPLYCNNVQHVQHSIAKHIDVRYHFIKEQKKIQLLDRKDGYEKYVSKNAKTSDGGGRQVMVRDRDGVLWPFPVACAWDTIQTMADIVNWYNVVWFPHFIPRYAIHMWLVYTEIDQNTKTVCFLFQEQMAVRYLSRLCLLRHQHIWLERNGRLFKKKTSSPGSMVDVTYIDMRVEVGTYQVQERCLHVTCAC